MNLPQLSEKELESYFKMLDKAERRYGRDSKEMKELNAMAGYAIHRRSTETDQRFESTFNN